MSRQLLTYLNGGTPGRLHRLLDDPGFQPRICWYPSAGHDFRDLLYLHPGFDGHPDFRGRVPSEAPLPEAPDFFLHTDYFPWQDDFVSGDVIFDDELTFIRIGHQEELPRCELPLHRQIVRFTRGGAMTHRVFYFELQIHSSVLGSFTRPLIYAFAENTAFCAQVLYPQQAEISHIVRVRYGGGLGGGGHSRGLWLLNVLPQLKCDCLVTNTGDWERGEGVVADERIYQIYPGLHGSEDEKRLRSLGYVPGHRWSGYGDVDWMVPQSALAAASERVTLPPDFHLAP